MIVVSPSLILTASPTLGPNNPVIGWRNLVTVAGVTATSEDADYPASDLANPATNKRWQSAVTTEQYLTFDVVTEDEVDYVGIARHNFGTGQITVSVEYPDPDSPGDWLELIPEFIPADDAPLLMRFVPTFLSQIRVRLQPTATAPRAAVAYVGLLLVLQRKIYVNHNPITMSRSADVLTGMSESGEFLGRVVLSERLGTGVNLTNLTPAWVRSDLMPFIQASKDTPFFFAWRPSEYPLEVGYAWLTNSPKPTNAKNNGMMSVDLDMGGVAL